MTAKSGQGTSLHLVVHLSGGGECLLWYILSFSSPVCVSSACLSTVHAGVVAVRLACYAVRLGKCLPFCLNCSSLYIGRGAKPMVPLMQGLAAYIGFLLLVAHPPYSAVC